MEAGLALAKTVESGVASFLRNMGGLVASLFISLVFYFSVPVFFPLTYVRLLRRKNSKTFSQKQNKESNLVGRGIYNEPVLYILYPKENKMFTWVGIPLPKSVNLWNPGGHKYNNNNKYSFP